MNDNKHSSQNQEIEVNLIDMMFYLLMQWKSLVIIAVIGALLGTGIYMIKKPQETEGSVSESIEEVEEKYDLDADVKENMELAYTYRQLYASQLKYNKNSILMQMDPNSVYKGSLEYYVSADSNTRLFGEFFQNILDDNNFLEEVKSAGDLECDLQFVQELLNCSLSQDDYQVVNISENSSEAHNIVISYSVLYTDKAACKKMLKAISDNVSSLILNLQEQYGEFEIVKTNDTVQMSISTDILNKQKSNADTINNYLSNITKIESAFDEKDLEYYETVYLSREIEDEEKLMEANPSTPESSPKDVIKWLIVGMFLACVCWGIYYIAKYLLDTHLKGAWELPKTYGIQLFGRVEAMNGKEKGITGFISRMNQKRKGQADTVEYITASLKSMNIGEVLLCFNHDVIELQQLSDRFLERCNNIIVGDMLHQDCDTLEKAKGVDGVILAVAVGKTDHKEIERELNVCNLQNIPVIGAVVLDFD